MKNSMKHFQTGAALLIFLTILILGMTAFLLAKLNQTPLKLENQAQTAQALAEAKTALLGFAMAYAENHLGQPQGYLPCPDFNGDGSSPYSGSSDTSCGDAGKSVIGRLPWKTLGLPVLRDGNGDCLWYAVSGTYKDRPKSVLTSDTNGLFDIQNKQGNTIVGNLDSNQAIAIIFSAGQLINNQNRSTTLGQATECGSKLLTDPVNDPRNYLDNMNNISNALGGDITTGGTFSFVDNKLWATSLALQSSWFIQSEKASVSNNEANVLFNDHLLAITPTDFVPVYRRMDSWVANRVKDCLSEYNQQYSENYLTIYGTAAPSNKYPWAAAITDETYSDSDEQRFGRIPQSPLSQTSISDNELPISWSRDPHFSKPEIDLLNFDFSGLDMDNPTDLQLLLTYLGLADEQSLRDKLGLTSSDLLSIELNSLKSSQESSLELQRCFSETGGIINWQWGWWQAWKDKVFVAINGNNSPTIDSTLNVLMNNIAKEVIILVSGRMLNGQNRTTSAEQAILTNYLENSNNDGDNDFITSDFNTSFNDTVITIP